MRWVPGTGASLSLRTPLCKWVAHLVGLLRPFWIDKASAYLGLAPPWLGPADFQGQFSPRLNDATYGLQSTYSGTVAVAMVDRDVVKQMLPPGLFLAEPKPSTWGSGKHPVLHMIGEQREPSELIAGSAIAIPGAAGYDEMIWIVPFVVRGTDTKWHNYAVRMYLNNLIPVFGGNELYGYAKELATLEHSQSAGRTHHKVTSTDLATTWFLDEIEVPAQWVTPGASGPLARWQDIRTILEMPVLGFRSTDNALVCSYWEMEYASATLAGTVSRHQVVTKFRAGMEAWETMGTVTSADNGAVSLRNVRWRLAWPWLVQGC